MHSTQELGLGSGSGASEAGSLGRIALLVVSAAWLGCEGNIADLVDSGSAADGSDVIGDSGPSGDAEQPADATEATDDTDGDGLPDDWEIAAGDTGLLDWNNPDSDGDEVDDGDEDYDGDGLSNLEELAAARLPSSPGGAVPHPFRVDILVELDAMAGRNLVAAVLAEAAAAYADLPTEGVSGEHGVGLIFYRDEQGIPAVDFADNTALREFLADHGPNFSDFADPPIPYHKMIHLVSVTRRSETPTVPATTVFVPGGGDIEETGAAIFVDAVEETHPACAGDITVEAAEAAGVVHELGHLLQLGHDTDVGGEVNHYNIMSLAADCLEASMRFFGTGNDDESLGSTEAVGASRFSWEAAALMEFENKLSVDTSMMVDADGVEM